MDKTKTLQLQPLSLGSMKAKLSAGWRNVKTPTTDCNMPSARSRQPTDGLNSARSKQTTVVRPSSRRVATNLSISNCKLSADHRPITAKSIKERLYRSICVNGSKGLENISPVQGQSPIKKLTGAKEEPTSSPTKEQKEFEKDFGFYMDDEVLKDADLFKESMNNTPQIVADYGRKISQLAVSTVIHPIKTPTSATVATPSSRQSNAATKSGLSTLQKLIHGVQMLKVTNHATKRPTKSGANTTKSLKAVLSSSTHGTEADLLSAHDDDRKIKGRSRFDKARSPATSKLTSALDIVAGKKQTSRRNSSIEYQCIRQ